MNLKWNFGVNFLLVSLTQNDKVDFWFDLRLTSWWKCLRVFAVAAFQATWLLCVAHSACSDNVDFHFVRKLKMTMSCRLCKWIFLLRLRLATHWVAFFAKGSIWQSPRHHYATKTPFARHCERAKRAWQSTNLRKFNPMDCHEFARSRFANSRNDENSLSYFAISCHTERSEVSICKALKIEKVCESKVQKPKTKRKKSYFFKTFKFFMFFT